MKKILVSGPSITQTEIDYVAQAVRDGWGENSNKYIGEFEKKFAAYIGTKYAIATSSCTGAMHISLLSLGIGKGDEVIVPDITWISTALAVLWTGATPVFADIEVDTWCIDPEDIEKKITKRTKAIMPVHLYGHPADMKRIKKIAKENNLYIIEDAAESIGSEINGKKTGGFGNSGCYSFHGSKLLVTGEGGMLVTNDKKLYKKALAVNSYYTDPKKLFWQKGLGYRYKMSNIQAALGTSQLARIDELLAKKRQLFQWYSEKLHDLPGIKLNYEKKGYKTNYWMITAIIDKAFKLKKEVLMKKLLAYGIQLRPFFYPLSSMPSFKKNYSEKKAINRTAYTISHSGINMPSGLSLQKDDIVYICNALKKILL